MILFIIYILGYIAAYYITKKVSILSKPDRNWYSIKHDLVISLLSWCTFIGAGLAYLTIKNMENESNNTCKSKPPKWL